MLRKRQNIIRVVVGLMLFLIGAELTARLWLSSQKQPETGPETHPPIVRMAAYKYAPYWSEEFELERRAALESFKYNYEGYFEGDFHGRWFNIGNGERATTDQPTNASHTIYMLGNSVLEGLHVPDSYTIASALQRLFNRTYPGKYRVVNAATAGMLVSLEWKRLQTLPLHRGDIVIFFDGYLDARDDYGSRPVIRRSYTLTGKACTFLDTRFNWLALGQVYCALVNQALPIRGEDASDPLRAQQVVAQFQSDVMNAHHYAKARGIHFFHFLQPQMLSQPLEPYEEELLRNTTEIPRDAAGGLRFNWPYLQTVQRTLANQGVVSYDLTHVLDSIRSQHIPVYLNMGHVTEQANNIIAAAIFNAITLL